MASVTDLKLNILSLNVRGLKNSKKRRAIFFKLKKENYDIIGLQETHLTDADKNIILREWGAKFYISGGSNKSKGLLTLFGKSINFENTSLLFSNDRFLISSLNSNGAKLLLANIYGACNNEEKFIFLNNLNSTIETNKQKYNLHNTIRFGDFNIVKSNDLDIISGNHHKQEIVDNFNTVINDMLLIDIWRDHNNSCKSFTWNSKTPFISRRLDYIFISADLLPFAFNPSIKTFGFSDHRAVTLNLDFASFKRGPGTFKFNTKHLHDNNFVSDVKQEIAQINSLDLNPHYKWEYMKIQIKNLGVVHGKSLAAKRYNNKALILMQIEETENFLAKYPNDQEALETFTNLKQQLEIVANVETEGARLRSGQKWAEEGEKCTKYFLNLVKQRSNSNTIFKLCKGKSNEIISGKDDILFEIADHFSSLYALSKEKYSDINEASLLFLDPYNRIQLKDDDKANLNINISEEELLTALKISKNGSSPGLDGLPGEVYKFFWADIKASSINCFNFSFKLVHYVQPKTRE